MTLPSYKDGPARKADKQFYDDQCVGLHGQCVGHESTYHCIESPQVCDCEQAHKGRECMHCTMTPSTGKPQPESSKSTRKGGASSAIRPGYLQSTSTQLAIFSPIPKQPRCRNFWPKFPLFLASHQRDPGILLDNSLNR